MSFISYKERTKLSAQKCLPGKNEAEQCCATSGYNHVSCTFIRRWPLSNLSTNRELLCLNVVAIFCNFLPIYPTVKFQKPPVNAEFLEFAILLCNTNHSCRAKPFTKDWRFLGAIVESLFCNPGILQIILKSLMLNIRSYSMTI